MVKRICLFIIATGLLAGCDTKLRHLTLDRTPYKGDELRIDGYYYAYPATYNQYTDETYVNVAVFYSDGMCIHTRGVPGNQDVCHYIENTLFSDDMIKKFKSGPAHIGVFQIAYPAVEIQVWEYRSIIYSYYGEIVDETTFKINKSKNHNTGKSYDENITYKFKEFSPKPDISNKYIMIDD